MLCHEKLQVISICVNGLEGLKAIIKHQPEIVFLDIEMPIMNGFQMLESLSNEQLHFALIFTTAYDQFAVKAFKFSAFDYLLKPIDDDELISTVRKLQIRQTPRIQIQALKENLRINTPFSKLTICSTRGIRFIDLTEIITLESDSNYTTFHLKTNESIIASKTLGYYADLLSDNLSFFRTHKQFIVNITYIKEYVGGDYSTILMCNNLEAKLARTRREAFMELFKL